MGIGLGCTSSEPVFRRSAEIRGLVVDTQGMPLGGVRVFVDEEESARMSTPRDGLFLLGGLEPGTYTVHFVAPVLGLGKTQTVTVNWGDILNLGQQTLESCTGDAPPACERGSGESLTFRDTQGRLTPQRIWAAAGDAQWLAYIQVQGNYINGNRLEGNVEDMAEGQVVIMLNRLGNPTEYMLSSGHIALELTGSEVSGRRYTLTVTDALFTAGLDLLDAYLFESITSNGWLSISLPPRLPQVLSYATLDTDDARVYLGSSVAFFASVADLDIGEVDGVDPLAPVSGYVDFQTDEREVMVPGTTTLIPGRGYDLYTGRLLDRCFLLTTAEDLVPVEWEFAFASAELVIAPEDVEDCYASRMTLANLTCVYDAWEMQPDGTALDVEDTELTIASVEIPGPHPLSQLGPCP